MGKSITAILEIVMIVIIVTGRLAATYFISCLLISSTISTGWKVFLLALTILVGLGYSFKYQNPYAEQKGIHAEQIKENR